MTTWTETPSSAHVERMVLTGMIVSDRALRLIGLAYKPQFLTADFGRDVARWCLSYQEKYDRAPRGDIQAVYESARRNGLSPESAQLIGQLLSSISQDFEREELFNEQLYIDTSLAYFTERSLTILKEDLEHHLQRGDRISAQASVADYHTVAKAIDDGFEPLTDMEGMKEAFSERHSLLRLPGDLGDEIGDLEREWLVMLIGKYKGSKSFTCQYIAQQALYAGLNVAWFDFELGKRRIIRRFAQGFCAMPLKPPKHDRLLIPVWDCKQNQFGECSRSIRTNHITLIGSDGKPPFIQRPVGYLPCTACKEGDIDTWFKEHKVDLLTWQTAWKKAEAVAQSVSGAQFRVQSWPKFSAGVDDVEATLHSWQYLNGFIPDVVIVDQPDIMKMEGRGDHRHKVNELWMRLGAIPQKRHCLMIAPSQAGGKAAQERGRLLDSDVSEESRKLGHVDMTIKIDQTGKDKDAQRALISVGLGRDDEASGTDTVMVLQCLGLGQAVKDSKFVKV